MNVESNEGVALSVLLWILRTSHIHFVVRCLLGTLAAIPAAAFTATHEFCEQYADTAVAQMQQAQAMTVPNIGPPMWHADHGMHYTWCRLVSETDANNENSKRQQVIMQNTVTKPVIGMPIGQPHKVPEFRPPVYKQPEERPVAELCNEYAAKSVKQSNDNKSLICRFGNDGTGAWSGDFKLHYDWCVRGDNRKKAEAELRKRDLALGECIELKSATLTATRPPDNDQNRKLFLIPGMVLNMRHLRCATGSPAPIVGSVSPSENPQHHGYSAYQNLGDPAITANHPVIDYYCGGDAGADREVGLTWNMVKDKSSVGLDAWTMPPGLVLGLKHARHQANLPITTFGYDAANDRVITDDFGWRDGGDRKSSSGVGYRWYETSGHEFTRWDLVDLLPKYTVIGLKHTQNQKTYDLLWKDKLYDCACTTCQPPPGFRRILGGDIGAGKGDGFCWFEKTTGPVPW